MYPGCPLTLTSSSLLLMKFKMKHNLTQQAMSDLLKLIRIHCPISNSLPKSLYVFNKKFSELKCPLQFHYYCSGCLQEVRNDEHQCPNLSCNESLKEDGAMSSFISIPLEPQLKSILERKLIYVRVQTRLYTFISVLHYIRSRLL